MFGNAVDVAVLHLQYLVQPVDQFDIGVAPQFAEYCRPFNGLISQTVQFAKQGNAADFAHLLGSKLAGRCLRKT